MSINSVLDYDYIGDVSNDTICFKIPHFTDLSSIIASFEISESATLRIDTIIQKSDTTANSFYDILNYRVVAENDSDFYSFSVKTDYALEFHTLGYSDNSKRVGGGDFNKEMLFEIRNIINGQWSYRLEMFGLEYEGVEDVRNNSISIPNYISEAEWLSVNGGEDFNFPVTVILSCDSLNIKDSTFTFNIRREQYTIRSWQDLQYMQKDLEGDYELVNDIEFPLPGTQGFSSSGFIPIGDSIARPFKGSFNGNNHVIREFYIRRFSDTARYIGLFGFVEKKMDIVPVIKNVGIEISNRTERGGVSGGWYTGGLIGWNEGKVINCYVMGDVWNDSPLGEPGACGGLIGCNYGGEVIQCSALDGIVTGPMHVGGLVGENSKEGKIERSCTNNEVYLSGLGDYDDQNDISGGGLVGRNILESEIINCYSTGPVNGRQGIGGFVGRHSTGATIRCCYTASKVLEVDGEVSETVGGFIGELFGDEDRRSVTDSYWNIASNPGLDGVGKGQIYGIDGRSPEDYKSEVMFLGWDFTSVWNISPEVNNGMAHLQEVKNP